MLRVHQARRLDREIADEARLLDLIARNKYLTMAMASGGEPYLVTLSYGFDPDARCFYFHCAGAGKKVKILKENPTVWGQVLDDLGYMAGECSHAYRSVHFKGRVTFIDDLEEKTRALSLMVDRLEPDPAPVKQRFLEAGPVREVRVGRVDVEFMTGKENAPKKGREGDPAAGT